MTEWKTKAPVYRRIGDAWVRTDQVAAIAFGEAGVYAHLLSGDRVLISRDGSSQAYEKAIHDLIRAYPR